MTPRKTGERFSFGLHGLEVRLIYDDARLALERRMQARSHADVAPLLARLVEPPGRVAAGLVDAAWRLCAVARVETRGRNACDAAAGAVYRAVIACGAQAVYLAHSHAQRALEPSAHDLASAARVFAAGFALGLELRDSLIFAADGRYVSLRERGAGVECWRRARERGEPEYPREYLRLHQAGNRRPERPSANRSEGARAALWQCPVCERRQMYKHACRYCGAPRHPAGASADRGA